MSGAADAPPLTPKAFRSSSLERAAAAHRASRDPSAGCVASAAPAVFRHPLLL